MNINKPFSSHLKILNNNNNSSEYRLSLFPTGYIRSDDIQNLSQFNISVTFRLLKIKYDSRFNSSTGFHVGGLLQLHPFKIHTNLRMKWEIDVSDQLNLSHGRYLSSKRSDIWILSCAPNGFLSSDSDSRIFTVRLLKIAFPLHPTCSYISNISAEIVLKILKLNYIKTTKMNFCLRRYFYDFKVSENQTTELSKLNTLNIECNIKIIELFDGDKNKIDPFKHEIFVENDPLRIEMI